MKTFYRRSLPHLVPPGAVLFITFRLQNSLPPDILEKFRKKYFEELSSITNNYGLPDKFLPWSPNNPKQSTPLNSERIAYILAFKKFFNRIDHLLDQQIVGPTWLKEPHIAEIVIKKLHSFDYKYYRIIAYTLMPNHVHVLLDTYCQIQRLPPNTPLTTDNYVPYQKFMHLLKGSTARKSNQLLNLTGRFWQKESWDHLIRNEEEFYRVITYILNNPVKAKLARRWQDHPLTWLNPEYHDLYRELHPL